MMAHTGFSGRTLVRLKETEEDSCLWRLRCEDNGFRTHVQTLLTWLICVFEEKTDNMLEGYYERPNHP